MSLLYYEYMMENPASVILGELNSSATTLHTSLWERPEDADGLLGDFISRNLASGLSCHDYQMEVAFPGKLLKVEGVQLDQLVESGELILENDKDELSVHGTKYLLITQPEVQELSSQQRWQNLRAIALVEPPKQEEMKLLEIDEAFVGIVSPDFYRKHMIDSGLVSDIESEKTSNRE